MVPPEHGWPWDIAAGYGRSCSTRPVCANNEPPLLPKGEGRIRISGAAFADTWKCRPDGAVLAGASPGTPAERREPLQRKEQ
jgi:hypothetical protein